ncbi:hypothetical protein BX616_000642, partial [Lobosporangium transversale]
NEKLQIVFVMLIIPLSMNIVQFWIIDYILKQKPTEKFPIRIDEDEEDLYGLVGGLERNYEEDEDEDDGMDRTGLNTANDLHSREEHDRVGSHHHHQQPLIDRLELETEENVASKHRDSEYGQFTSGSTRRL